MQIRKTYDSEAAVVSLTPGSGITIDTGESTITVFIGAVATAALAAGNYGWDLEVYDLSNTQDVDRYLQGQVRIDPEVTHG